MNTSTDSNIKLNLFNTLFIIRKQINKGIIKKSAENIINRQKEIILKNKKNSSSKEINNKLQKIINLNNKIININESQLNLLNKNEFNLDISKSENSNSELTKLNLNKLNSTFLNELEYIKLISPFNSKLASFTTHIYTFTNKSYKQINNNLSNLYLICYSALINMSSIISQPMISINPNLIKITLFFYWKPLREKYYDSNLHSKFLILYFYNIEKLVNLLSKFFKRSVELELIRIYSPQNESNILANFIGILSNFIKFRNIHMKLFKVSKIKNTSKETNNIIPSFLSGIYLKLAGRLLTQKLQRRVKSKIVQKGSLSRINARLINTNRFVNKNKRGVFSITVKTGHIINN